MNAQRHPLGQKLVDQHESRGLADVVRAGLESQAPDGQRLVLERGAVMFADFVHQYALLGLVDPIHGLHHV